MTELPGHRPIKLHYSEQLIEARARIADLQRELEAERERADAAYLEGVRVGANARESGEKAATYRADMTERRFNEVADLVGETSQEKLDLQAQLATEREAHASFAAEAYQQLQEQRAARQRTEEFANQIQTELDIARQDRQNAEERVQRAEGERDELRTVVDAQKAQMAIHKAAAGINANASKAARYDFQQAEVRLADAVGCANELRHGSGVTGGGLGDAWHAMHRAYNHTGEFEDCRAAFCPPRRAFLARIDASSEP